MITDADIKRINELYHKSKSEGLTPEEKQEQVKLREAYIELSCQHEKTVKQH